MPYIRMTVLAVINIQKEKYRNECEDNFPHSLYHLEENHFRTSNSNQDEINYVRNWLGVIPGE